MGRKIVLIVLPIFIIAIIIFWQYNYNSNYYFYPESTIPIPYGSPVLWDRILEEPGTINVPSSTRIVILPHHLITATELTKIYRGISKKFQPKKIILIGPNHYEDGEANIQTCNCTYSTNKGELKTSTKQIDKAIKNKIAVLNDEPFENEHSIYAHATFIKNFFPDSEIIPFILKHETTSEEIDRLISFIGNIENSDDMLLIASVDFSHYLPHAVADFHDQSSFSAIQNFNLDDIQNIEVDSPATLRLATKWAEKNDYTKVTLLAHTNSQDFFYQQKLEKTTSHLYISFSKGNMEALPKISIHFFGDAMLGRGIAPLIESKDFLADLAGEENRFFQGNNFNVLNLEGVLTEQNKSQEKPIIFRFDPDKVLPILRKYNFNAVNLANNHILDYFLSGYEDTQKYLNEKGIIYFGAYDINLEICKTITKNDLSIALCGFNDVGEVLQTKQALQAVVSAKEKHDLVFLNIHWGEEYSAVPTIRQKNLAKQFIDSGADLIIGHHPHVIQPMEIYNGKPIFYSLGNFIFDQNFPEGTNTGLSVGIVSSSKEMFIYLLPFYTNKGNPKMLNNEEMNKFLLEFNTNSSNYQTDIPGKLKINL